MRKFIYQSIIEKLKEIKDESGNPVILHFDIWNNNLVYIQEEQAFYTPAVFIEFQPIQWRHQGGGAREAAVGIVLHVVTQRNEPTLNDGRYEERALRFFDLLTDINRVLHGHFKSGVEFGHDALTATQSNTDHDFDELQENIEIFTCHAQDVSAMPVKQTISTSVKINI
ncbi:MAG: hypothetical protein LBJ72_12505 [Dysgonamonadaceae bacterium]|jgi:hypothetical protein|nr:hypothetical protein [Dysgonamonadaceae bacterium]